MGFHSTFEVDTPCHEKGVIAAKRNSDNAKRGDCHYKPEQNNELL